MVQQDVMIQNKLGLHARAAAKFVATASQFPCHVAIRFQDLEVNGKSIMGVMMLAAGKGSTITLVADGEQEQEAICALQELVN